MISRKQLEIQLSQQVAGFETPKIEYEQYQTPARVAANLLHIAASRDDITDKNVVDLCAGTGILGIGAAILGAEATCVELDSAAFEILKRNGSKLDVKLNYINTDVLKWEPSQHFDTAILNPPFGIQQKKVRDMNFVQKAAQLAHQIYSIHDGSETNQQEIPNLFEKLGLEIIEAYIDEFPLNRSYPWHKKKQKMYQVLIIHSTPF